MATTGTSQDNADGDPTVYLPATVTVTIYTEQHPAADGRRRVSTLYLPAEHVTLNREFLFIRRPGVPASTVPLHSVRTIRIDIQPPPDDYDALREQYPHAYDPWFGGDIAGLVHQRHMGSDTAEIAERTGRPPEHVQRKLAEPFPPADEASPPQRREPAPLLRADPEQRVAGAYIVSIRPGAQPLDVAARHGIDPSSVERALNTFSAEITDAQVESLRYDPDTEYLSEDHLVYPA